MQASGRVRSATRCVQRSLSLPAACTCLVAPHSFAHSFAPPIHTGVRMSRAKVCARRLRSCFCVRHTRQAASSYALRHLSLPIHAASGDHQRMATELLHALLLQALFQVPLSASLSAATSVTRIQQLGSAFYDLCLYTREAEARESPSSKLQLVDFVQAGVYRTDRATCLSLNAPSLALRFVGRH